ncbi:hypothetical protein LTR78_003284 [Recurvomyces mirabilis]|uniref:Heterokaryon incompatibility domain-containing protein n=1 Tax=Recurvomyces mirabilis TaxID=574656 RepID=A0AAE0WS99_9PEZI|nr:hypothetical protein LTR78_003284 [Recurvomyces mirabilis]
MHLLYTDKDGKLALKQVLTSEAGSYAILSHRWRDGEVTFQDMQQPSVEVENKPGYRKLRKCMHQARKDGWKTCWIDTCCINKESSAELQEAINSMWTWYANARVCYAYLDDIEIVKKDSVVTESDLITLGNAQKVEGFSSSGWFGRGWTLQELLAPRVVEFYDKTWQWVGSKRDLSSHINSITGIDPGFLVRPQTVRNCSVALRLSWAATRTTTRIEDAAYCLLGLLDINMPLLYGEGNKAFKRLQEEVIRVSADISILCWSWPGSLANRRDFKYGILATNADGFSQDPGFSPLPRDGSSLTLLPSYLEIGETDIVRLSPSNLCLAVLEGHNEVRKVCLLLRWSEIRRMAPYSLDVGVRLAIILLESPYFTSQVFPSIRSTIRIAQHYSPMEAPDVWEIEYVCKPKDLTKVVTTWPLEPFWKELAKRCWCRQFASAQETLRFAASLQIAGIPAQRLTIALAIDTEQPTRPCLVIGKLVTDLEQTADHAVATLLTTCIRAQVDGHYANRTRETVTIGGERLQISVSYKRTERTRGEFYNHLRYTLVVERAAKTDKSTPLSTSKLINGKPKLPWRPPPPRLAGPIPPL